MGIPRETSKGRRALIFFVLGLLGVVLFVALLIFGQGSSIAAIFIALLAVVCFVLAWYQARMRPGEAQREVPKQAGGDVRLQQSSQPVVIDQQPAQPAISKPAAEVEKVQAPQEIQPSIASPVITTSEPLTEADKVQASQEIQPSITSTVTTAPEVETPIAESKELESAVQQAEAPPASDLETVADEPLIEAYCMKCKKKIVMLHPHKVVMKNGRPAMEGTCPVCGTKVFRIGSF